MLVDKLDMLVTLPTVVESTGRWSGALTEGLIALVPKKAAAGGPMEQRPVTLTNLAYRLWSGTRCRQSATWIRSWSHDRAAGVPGRGADLVWGGMAVRSEVARLEGSPLAGLSADLAKFFDLVDPHIAIALLEELGLPPLTPEVPWHGYSLGDWNSKWEAMARRATDGDYLINGERTAQLKQKLKDPQVSIRDVMGDDFNPDEE